MASSGFFHRRNGIALIVLLAMLLTITILVILKPNTFTQYVMYSVIICVLWLIPSIMYYMLILNYKKTITSNVIPDIVLSLVKTLQSMYGCDKYSAKQQEIIGQVAGETIVKSVMKKHPDTDNDVQTIMENINESSPEDATEKRLEDIYGIVDSASLIPSITKEHEADMQQIIEKTRTESKRQMGAVDRHRNGIDINEISARANDRRMRNIDIDKQIQEHKRAPVDDSSQLKKELMQSINMTFSKRRNAMYGDESEQSNEQSAEDNSDWNV